MSRTPSEGEGGADRVRKADVVCRLLLTVLFCSRDYGVWSPNCQLSMSD